MPADRFEVPPEDQYKQAASQAERTRLQTAVLMAYRTHVAGFVRRFVHNPAHRPEAEQVGLLGLLVALEKYDPSLLGADRGARFWSFATLHVRYEVQRWMDVGVHWR